MNKQEFQDEFRHFCSVINFGASALDNRAIVFMNEFGLNLDSVIKEEG